MTGPRRRRRATPKTPTPPVKIDQVIEEPKSGPPSPLFGTVTSADVRAVETASEPPHSGSGGEKSPPVTHKERRRRTSVGGHSLKLTAPQREGETRRWVNDDGNRIAEAQALGYEFVSETGIQTADPGSRVSRLVGTKANGEPLHAYLMETPDELYAQGASEKEAANRQIDEAITAGRDSTGRMDENQYGHGSIKTDR